MTHSALDAARGMSDLITGLRGQTEADRRIAQPIVDKLIDARLFRMAVIEDLGGLGLPTVDALDVFETLAGYEASVGWVVWNNSLPALFSRFLSAEARAEIFADPAWLYGNSTRPSGRAVAVAGKDGYRVTGQWALVSGCELAEWMPLTCLVEEDGELRMAAPGVPEIRLVFVRKGQYEILDTWHVGGLRGTGSHDVVVRDLFVRGDYTLTPGDTPTIDHPIGRVPIIMTLAAGFAAQALGIAQSALDTVIAMGKTNITPGPVADLRDRPLAQTQVASGSAALAAARGHLHWSVAAAWDSAVTGAPLTLDEITRVWGAALHANEAARNTVDAMSAAGGTAALYTGNPLERAHRDIHAMMRHMISAPGLWEQAGRVAFGLAPSDPLYAV